LQLSRALYDCTGFCCNKPGDCDRVCPNRPEAFADSVREIAGFEFDNIPAAPVLAKPSLPLVAPVIFHGSKRDRLFRAEAICLPLYGVIARHNGETRYANRASLAECFGFVPDTPIILTGTATDQPLERWWSLGQKRPEAIRALRGLGVAMVTTPNYSLFTDRPRWDDLHSMKRIAIVHEEFLREGIPAALHLNARTEKDWDRWKQHIADRPEITHVAFEFATGPGWASRTAWYVNQLTQLARAVGRPLHLVMRGGTKILPELTAAFAGVTLLETTVFMKTKSRQRAIMTAKGGLSWVASPTKPNETVDSLLEENWKIVAAYYEPLFRQRVQPMRRAG
jgi:hypothetical protein